MHRGNADSKAAEVCQILQSQARHLLQPPMAGQGGKGKDEGNGHPRSERQVAGGCWSQNALHSRIDIDGEEGEAQPTHAHGPAELGHGQLQASLHAGAHFRALLCSKAFKAARQ